MLKTGLMLCATLALGACSPPPGEPATTATAAAPTTSASSATRIDAAATALRSTLPQFHWRLVAATDAAGGRIDALFARADKPLQLDFGTDSLSVSNTCNRLRGSYRIEAGRLHAGHFASTLMACANPRLAALDQAVGQRLRGDLGFSLDGSGTVPRLTLLTTGGDTLVFDGAATDETRYGSHGETVFLEVAAKTAACNDPQSPGSQCLQVRELHYDDRGLRRGEPGPWQPLAAPIDGYSHEDGVRNVLRVKRYHLADAPAGAASTAYALDMVVETELPKAQ